MLALGLAVSSLTFVYALLLYDVVMSGGRLWQHELRRGLGDGSRWKDPLTDPDIEAAVPVKEGEQAKFFVLRSLNHDNLAVS